MNTLYTFGYLGTKAEKILGELIAVRTPIIDVRFSSTSKHYRYTQEGMRSRDEIDYYHIQELGNELYKEALTGSYKEPHIKIADIDVGVRLLHTIVEKHHRAAIFCACASKTKCHRIAVADEYKFSLRRTNSTSIKRRVHHERF